MWRHIIAALTLCLAVAPVAHAQEQQDDRPLIIVQPPNEPPPFANLRGFSEDYKVGPGDMLEIQVVGVDQLRYTLRVSNSGEISFPALGLVQVNETTPFEIEAAIADRLRQQGLVQQPEVLVLVKDYQAKPVYVQGAVLRPGEFIMSQELTAGDAILLAGGLRANAADEGLIHRRRSGPAADAPPASASSADPRVEIIKFDLKGLKQGRFSEADLRLRRGDVIVVPDQMLNTLFVVGELYLPRNFFYQPTKTIMASQAIAMAGGPLPTAKLSEGILVRYDPQGARTEMKVDWGAILDGKQPDIRMQPNDIIFVPGSTVKVITTGLLALTDTMVMSASFRVARTYQLPSPPDQPPDTGQ